MKTVNSVSVVIPVYNEEGAIGNTLIGVDRILKNMDIEYEIIVVDDGSTDKTALNLQDVLQSIDHIRLLRHENNRGYGAALKTGCKKSNYEKILIIDADNTYPIEQIPLLLKTAASYEMVVGSRTAPGAKLSFLRQIPKFFLRKLAEALSGRKIPDLNSGFRIFSKSILDKYLHMLPNGFSFTTTITLLMFQGEYDVLYIPVEYYIREGKSKIKPIRDTLNFFQLILRTVLFLNPLKVFVPLSLLFFLSSIILMFFRVFVDVKFGVTIVLLFTTGCQMLAIGVLADLIAKRLKA